MTSKSYAFKKLYADLVMIQNVITGMNLEQMDSEIIDSRMQYV